MTVKPPYSSWPKISKWPLKQKITTLALTNEIFLTTNHHLLKLSRFGQEPFLNRENEINVLKTLRKNKFPHTILASGWGNLSDGRFYSVYRYLPDLKPLTSSILTEQKLHKIKIILTQLHQIPVQNSQIKKFNPIYFLQKIKNQIKTPVPFNLNEESEILKWITNYQVSDWVLCHSDLVLANLVTFKNQIMIIDFEYAYLNDPLYDIASLIAEGLTNSADTKIWLKLWQLNQTQTKIVWHWMRYQNLKNTFWAWLMWEQTQQKKYQTIALNQYQRLINPLFAV